MEYPKQIMRMRELIEMGVPEETLQAAYRMPGQTFARKSNPLKKNSPIVFDTKGLEKWWERMENAQRKARG